MDATPSGSYKEDIVKKSRRDSSTTSRSENTKCKRRVLEYASPTRHSSGESSPDSDHERRKKKHKKHKTKEEKRSKKKKKKRLKKLKKQLEKVMEENKTVAKSIGPNVPQDKTLERQRSTEAMKPMTKDEWEKQQQETRYVVDEETGRRRLVRGSGEILEEIVSKDRQKEINKQATSADGLYFMKKTGQI